MNAVNSATAMPFTSFELTLRRQGGVADVDVTLELRWEGEAGSITVRRRDDSQSATVQADRVRTLWQQLEATGFWDSPARPRTPLARLGRFFLGPSAMDAMMTTVSASAVIDGSRRSAGFSVSSPPRAEDARALEALRVIDRFFSGRDSAD
jgi:hypothetical protein